MIPRVDCRLCGALRNGRAVTNARQDFFPLLILSTGSMESLEAVAPILAIALCWLLPAALWYKVVAGGTQRVIAPAKGSGRASRSKSPAPTKSTPAKSTPAKSPPTKSPARASRSKSPAPKKK